MFRFLYRILPNFKPRNDLAQTETLTNIPAHIAIIMDGNGRWAQSRGLPRIAGHRMGTESLRRTVKVCAQLGVKYLTAYAFSTENWGRPKEEVDFLMSLLGDTIDKVTEELKSNNVILRFLGGIDKLNENLQKKISNAMDSTKNNTGLTLNILLNYGGKAEISMAVQKIAPQVARGEISDISDAIDKNIYTAGIPDPDLLIRTGGEKRISNFLLWQTAYSEYYFTDTYWPDFDKEQLLLALTDYQKRKRRFGKVS